MAQKTRSISARTSSKTTSIAHNNRTPDSKGKLKDYGKHIHWDKTADNKILVDEPIKDAYEDLFHDAVVRKNQKQKRKDRKIDESKGGYLKHVESMTGLDAQREFIVQFGTKEDESIPMKTSDKMFEKYLDSFEKRYPDLHVYNATIHNDESTAHMHINFIPVASGYKTGMDKRPSFSKVLKSHGIEFKDFFDGERDELESIMQDSIGESRSKVGTHDYLTPQQMREQYPEVRSAVASANIRESQAMLNIDKAVTVLSQADASSKEAKVDASLASADSASASVALSKANKDSLDALSKLSKANINSSVASNAVTSAKIQSYKASVMASNTVSRAVENASSSADIILGSARAKVASSATSLDSREAKVSSYESRVQIMASDANDTIDTARRLYKQLEELKQEAMHKVQALKEESLELLKKAKNAMSKTERDSVASQIDSASASASESESLDGLDLGAGLRNLDSLQSEQDKGPQL